MEESKKGYWLNDGQYDALLEAWEMISFVEGAVSPKLEVIDTDTTPFANGLYRNIQEIKKRIDFTLTEDEGETAAA